MLGNLTDEKITILLRVAKKSKGLRPFFGNPKGMIALRDEAYRRGIYLTAGDRAEHDRMVDEVCWHMEDRDGKRRMAAGGRRG